MLHLNGESQLVFLKQEIGDVEIVLWLAQLVVSNGLD